MKSPDSGPLKLAPVFSERPWGGTRLRDLLGKATPPGKLIGESWELSDHPHGRSIIADGPLAGAAFGAVVREAPRDLLGCATPPARFPLLVKYIDTAGVLSLQVHPDDAWCKRTDFDDRGKSECWYMMHCAADAELMLGVRKGVTEKHFREALDHGDPAPLLNKVPIKPGSFVAVPPGTVHAIPAGTLLCEIQQSSDATLRLWDWGRVPARPLHIEQALSAIAWDREPPRVQLLPLEISSEASVERGLLANEFFRVRSMDIAAGESATIRLPSGRRHGWAVCVVLGSGEWADGRAISLGDTWFLPASLSAPLGVNASAGMRLLMAESLEIG